MGKTNAARLPISFFPFSNIHSISFSNGLQTPSVLSTDAVLKQLESSRTTGKDIYWTYEANKKRKIDYNLDKVIYEAINNMTLQDLFTFFDQHIKDKKFSVCVIGNPENVDKKVLNSMGTVKELSLEELFGY